MSERIPVTVLGATGVVGQRFVRKPPKRADYLLFYRRDFCLAVVEAKAELDDHYAMLARAPEPPEGPIIGEMEAWALEPLADAFAQRFRDFLPIATYPVRVGTHFNTAFGLRMAADYADATGDGAFLALLR